MSWLQLKIDTTKAQAPVLEELLETLKKLHFLAQVSNSESEWLPARDPSVILLEDLLTALRGKLPPAEEHAAACKAAIDLLGREADIRRESLKAVTIHDLLTEGKG